jgi:hypothetical protein
MTVLFGDMKHGDVMTNVKKSVKLFHHTIQLAVSVIHIITERTFLGDVCVNEKIIKDYLEPVESIPEDVHDEMREILNKKGGRK